MKNLLTKKRLLDIRLIKTAPKISYLVIILILITPFNLASLTTIIKYKGSRDQKLTNCASDEACDEPPLYENYYTKNIRAQTEYINNQLVYTAELQWRTSMTTFECMFCHCSNIISINLNSFDTSECNTMTALFKGCSSLIYVDLGNFVISKATYIAQMFFGCSSIISLDLSSLRGTYAQYIDSMFRDCSSLTYLNLENINFRNIIGMGQIFRGCTSLVSLYLPEFYTQNAKYMDRLFYDCRNLQYINIQNVMTSFSTNITDMFHGMPPNFVICYLASGSIDNEIKNNPCRVRDCSGNWKSVQKKYVVNSQTCVDDCKSNNLYEYESKCYNICPFGTLEHKSMLCKTCNTVTKNCDGCSMLDSDNDLCITCKSGFYEIYDSSNINSYFKKCYQSPIGYYLDEIEEIRPFYKPCFNSCLTCNNKGNETGHNCQECKPEYIFEIDYTSYINCYQTCEYYHYTSIERGKSYCTEKLKCPEQDYIKLLTDMKECVKSCNHYPSKFYYEYHNKCYKECPLGLTEPHGDSSPFCVPKYIYSLNNKTQLIIDIQEYLLYVFDGTEVDYGQDLEIQGDGIFVEITTPQNQVLNEINSNKTTVNLGECENILSEKNKNDLYIMKIDIEEEGIKIPIVEYEVYHQSNEENLEKLNLTECENTNIDISIPVELSQELYKHNASDEYYNNKCIGTTSDSGTDICLKDRRNDFIEQNLTLCEENCVLIGYNYTTNRAKCNCKMKIKLPIIDEIRLDKKELLKSFTDIKGYFTNIDVVKCYKTVFRKKELIKNIGFFISIGILLFLIICFILFYSKYFEKLKKQIFIIAQAVKAKYNIKKKKYCLNTKCNCKTNLKLNNNNTNNINKRKELTNLKINTDKSLISSNPPVKKISKFTNKKNLKKENNLKTSGKGKNFQGFKKILEYNDSEKNELSYKKALKYDKRTFLQYYYSLLKTKNLFLFAFFPNNDYNSRIIKIFLFFFSFFTELTINALYFTDDTMHKIYTDHGKFDFLYNIPQIVFSFLISYGLDSLIGYLSQSEEDVIRIKNAKKKKKKKKEEDKDKKNTIKFSVLIKKVLYKISVKFVFFFLISFIIVLVFGFYITCFCGVYKNTQIHLITDSGMSFGLSLVTPFIISLFPAFFRIPSLRAKNQNLKYMYKLSNILEII